MKKVSVGWPTIAAVALAAIGAAAQIVNYSFIGASEQVHATIGLFIYGVLAAGVPPLTGTGFRAALHMSEILNGLVSAMMGVGLLALTTIHMPEIAHEIVAVVLTSLSSLGFSAAVTGVPVEEGK